MNLEIFITAGVGLLSSIVTGWTTWFFTRKKYNSEVDSTIIDNMKNSLDFYKMLSEDNKKQLGDVLKTNQNLEEEVKKLSDKNQSLENQITELRNQMFNMMANICMDLTCANRFNDLNKKRKRENEIKDKQNIQRS